MDVPATGETASGIKTDPKFKEYQKSPIVQSHITDPGKGDGVEVNEIRTVAWEMTGPISL